MSDRAGAKPFEFTCSALLKFSSFLEKVRAVRASKHAPLHLGLDVSRSQRVVEAELNGASRPKEPVD